MQFQPKKKHEEENPEPYTGLFVSAASATLAGIVGLSLGFASGAIRDHNEERAVIETKLSNIDSRIISERELAESRKEVSEYFRREMTDLRKQVVATERALREQEEEEKTKNKKIVDIMRKAKIIKERVNEVNEDAGMTHEEKKKEINRVVNYHVDNIERIIQSLEIEVPEISA